MDTEVPELGTGGEPAARPVWRKSYRIHVKRNIGVAALNCTAAPASFTPLAFYIWLNDDQKEKATKEPLQKTTGFSTYRILIKEDYFLIDTKFFMPSLIGLFKKVYKMI